MSLRYRFNLDASPLPIPKSSPKAQVPSGKAVPGSPKLANVYSAVKKVLTGESKSGTSKTPPKSPAKKILTEEPWAFRTFTAAEMKRLGRRFRKLDSDNSGTVSLKEFLKVPEIRKNVLANRVVEVLDTNKNGEVDFREFVLGMSQFATDNQEGRLRFAFRIYDLDGNGFITNGELFQVIKLMVGDNMKDVQIQEAVDHTIMMGDKDGDGKISFNEFAALVKIGGAFLPGGALSGF